MVAKRQPRFRLAPLTEAHGRLLCTWRYEPPYDLYNLDSWDDMVRERAEFADPAVREQQYAAVLDEEGVLCGFAQYFPLAGEDTDTDAVKFGAPASTTIRIGLGLRPDLCGEGLGLPFVRTIVAEAQRRAPDADIDLEVLTWNTRAAHVYEKAGFVVVDRYVRPTPGGSGEFYCMEYRPGSR